MAIKAGDFEGSTNVPSPGLTDLYAYLAIRDGKRGWFRSFDQADKAGQYVIQRTLTGRNRGSEWTVKGGV